ncbi:hypothetical protein GCM10007854_14430 [Algimonas porphyrae]|uniref:Uncharacterized protein n=1 Tax=Algimonas porphyrae TaxID=1128113 RepID=A0ABQ5UZD8_9PROT|nr:hypothetical protein GCM10007854_14430 [Algimonas porphyrae]
MWTALALATMCLTACGTTPEVETVVVREYVCPLVEPWPADLRAVAADDLMFLPPSSPVFDLLASAIRLRDSVKACHETKKQQEKGASE